MVEKTKGKGGTQGREGKGSGWFGPYEIIDQGTRNTVQSQVLCLGKKEKGNVRKLELTFETGDWAKGLGEAEGERICDFVFWILIGRWNTRFIHTPILLPLSSSSFIVSPHWAKPSTCLGTRI